MYLVCACVYVRVHTFEFEHFLLWCVRVSMYGCVLNFEFELFLHVVCVHACMHGCVLDFEFKLFQFVVCACVYACVLTLEFETISVYVVRVCMYVCSPLSLNSFCM